jgi:hypothetical protein
VWVGVLAGGVLLLGVRRLSVRTWTPICCAGLLTMMLWLWPYQEVRLVMPLVPVLGMLLVAGFSDEADPKPRASRSAPWVSLGSLRSGQQASSL